MYLIELKEHQNCSAMVGRSLLALLFVMSAFLKMLNWQACLLLLENRGLPMAPQLLAIAVAVELVGGFALMTGVLSRVAALILILYLIPVTGIMHSFWSVPIDQAAIALTEFVKNIAIMGGLFMVIAFGPGTHVVREPQAKVVPAEETKPPAKAEPVQAKPEPQPQPEPEPEPEPKPIPKPRNASPGEMKSQSESTDTVNTVESEAPAKENLKGAA